MTDEEMLNNLYEHVTKWHVEIYLKLIIDIYGVKEVLSMVDKIEMTMKFNPECGKENK